MGFDYSYTCPKIDKEINSVKSTIGSFLKDYIERLCPLMSSSTVLELSNDWTEELYESLESAFETVRETNSDIRAAAENQIDKLEERISEMEDEIEALEEKLDTTY
jgi:vacuolar-type H+-ATPase subunit I/STV1